MFMCVVLVLAWSLSSVTGTLDTAGYLIHVSSGFLAPGMLPLVMFLIGAVMSLRHGHLLGHHGHHGRGPDGHRLRLGYEPGYDRRRHPVRRVLRR